jgi:hypothetical protein
MKRNLAILVSALVLTACGSMKPGAGNIVDQKLSTSFVNDKIKIESKCSWFGMGSECNVVAIESVGTAVSFGNTPNNRRVALKRAEMQANANVSEFLAKEINSARVSNTISKNIEKASDKIASGKADNQAVEMSDQEAKNISIRENNNDTVVQLTETIRTNSRAILRGFKKVEEKVVGDQEVSVTIRWDLESDAAASQLRKRFGN